MPSNYLLNVYIAIIFSIVGVISHGHYILNKCDKESIVELDNTSVVCQVYK